MGYMMFYVSWSPRERVDTAAIKRDMPEVAARYTKMTTTRRFTFA